MIGMQGGYLYSGNFPEVLKLAFEGHTQILGVKNNIQLIH